MAKYGIDRILSFPPDGDTDNVLFVGPIAPATNLGTPVLLLTSRQASKASLAAALLISYV